jgi:hypothetical protein
MPFTDQEIAEAGVAVLDHYLRNKPIDQIAVERVLLKALMPTKKEVAAAKQYISEQIRDKYQSNFQWFNGAQVVTYNRRHTIQQTQFPWRSAHDGVSIDEDRLIQHGITVTDGGPGGAASGSEISILTNLLEEQMEVLRLGFEERFSKFLHLDGTSSTDALAGLDALVSTAPTTGTLGGISRATNPWWRNQVSTGIDATVATGTFLDKMELIWRQMVRNGGRPNKIIVGGDFYDAFRNFMLKTYGKMDFGAVGFKRVQAGTEMLTFHGVEMEWAPEFSDIDAEFGGSPTWEKRCYFLRLGDNMKLRPMKGQYMITRKPPRPYDRYEYYWAITWRGALTVNRLNGMGVAAIS